jgi:Na+/proline symporter
MARRRTDPARGERISVNAGRATVLASSVIAFAVSLTNLPLQALATLSLFIIWGSACFVPIYGGLLWCRDP